MPIETLILILALIGSAKMALDIVVSALTAAVRRNQPKPQDPAELAKTLQSVVESLDLISQSHRAAVESNKKLMERLLDFELSLDNLMPQETATPVKPASTPAKRKSTKTKMSIAEPSKASDAEVAQSTKTTAAISAEAASDQGPPFYLDGDRFEVVR